MTANPASFEHRLEEYRRWSLAAYRLRRAVGPGVIDRGTLRAFRRGDRRAVRKVQRMLFAQGVLV